MLSPTRVPYDFATVIELHLSSMEKADMKTSLSFEFKFTIIYLFHLLLFFGYMGFAIF